MTDDTTPVAEALAWEAGHRRTASAAGVVGGIVLLVFTLLPGTPGPNRFG